MATMERKHPSVIPIYGAAAVWLLYCLFAPMVRWYAYLIGLAVAAAAYLILRRFFPGTVEKVEIPEPKTGNELLDEALARGREEGRRLQALNDAIPHAAMSRELDEIVQLHGKILDALREDPSKLSQARKFLGYYPPTTIRLLEQYEKLQTLNFADGNIAEAKKKIETMLSTVKTAYRRQLDSLYDRDVMDITADIQVLEHMMAGDGLTGETLK